MSMKKPFYQYELNGKEVVFSEHSIIEVQMGKNTSNYKTHYEFQAKDFHLAIFYYNALNIGNGYKARLICKTLNRPVLAKKVSFPQKI